jgi:regulator of protease activity HflC (stomatin/prohibitin superfamily)
MKLHIIQTAILVIVIGVIAFLTYRKYSKISSDHEVTEKEYVGLIVQSVALLAVGFLLISSFTYVKQGYACLTIDPITGNINGPVLGERFFFRMPWTRTIQIYYATLSTEMWTDQESQTRGEYPAVKVLSKDGLDIEVDILIRYELDPHSLIALYKSYPDLRYEDKAVSSITREDVRDVISKYTTLEVVELRETISIDMTNKMLNSLQIEPSLKGALKNVQIDLRDIDPPASFKQAVQEKKKAEQQKLQAEHERETKLIQADASAKEAIRKAEGEATATMIRANATKSALEAISTQIDPDIYYSLQMLKEIAPHTKYLIMTMGDDGVPVFLQAPTE